jgi:hypothetical protein
MNLKDPFQHSQKPITDPDLTLLQNPQKQKNSKSQTWTDSVILTAINEIWVWWPLVLSRRTYPSALVQAYIHCAFELHICWLWELKSTEFGWQKVPINSVKVLKQVWIHWTPATILHIFKRHGKVTIKKTRVHLPRRMTLHIQQSTSCNIAAVHVF